MRKFLRFLLWTVLILGTLVGLLRLFAIRFFYVPDDAILSASVRPNLEGGDLVILWRLTAPRYGELVVCPEPGNPGESVVGRIMAEAGDVVEVKGDFVYVNGDETETEMACPEVTTIHPDTQAELEQKCSVEVAGTHKHWIAQTSGHPGVPQPVKDELAEGEVYLVSDNRLLPYDSRDYGAVERTTCKESVVFRLVSARGWGDAQNRLTYIR